jgi:hypothetical protein
LFYWLSGGIDWGKGIDGIKSIYPNRSKANRSSWPIFLLLMHCCRIGSGFNGVPGTGSKVGKNDPQKWKKVYTFHVFKYWMFSFESLRLIL